MTGKIHSHLSIANQAMRWQETPAVKGLPLRLNLVCVWSLWMWQQIQSHEKVEEEKDEEM